MNRIPMTVSGQRELQRRLFYLKNTLRPQIIRDISHARKKGDLKENSEYHSAREQQSFCEGQIQHIEGKLANAQIVDVRQITPNGRVVFGSTVEIEEQQTGTRHVYRIVGDDEANLEKNSISVYSPIARGLIGKTAGSTIMVRSPMGTTKYKIIEVQYL